MFTRRHLLHTLAAAAATALVWPAQAAKAPRRIEVWKSPSCGCCGAWVEHLQQNGFEVAVHEVEAPGEYRARLGLPDTYGSCHTGRIGGYVLEGHVPAREIVRLLKEKPDALGLAVPGMPVGSPGMEVGARKDPYDVLLVTRDGKARVYQKYP